MFCASTNAKSNTIGAGKGGVTDKILYGSDSRHVMNESKARSTPPSLQDVIFQSLVHELVRVILVDQTEIVGKLLWYHSGNFCIREGNESRVLSCNRIMSMSPIDIDEDVVPFLTESVRNNMLASEEKTSRLQIVKRRIRERNKRMAAAAKYSNSFS